MKKPELKKYIDELSNRNVLINDNTDINTKSRAVSFITYDTREIQDGSLFLCKGANFKPEYLDYALQNGAFAYITATSYGRKNEILVSDIREAMTALALLYYDNAPAKLISIGLTGTKGKSTTVYYLREIIDRYLENEERKKCAFISSIDTYDGKERFESHITTPETFELHRHFSNAVDSGISHLLMEVSSQALKYGRVRGICFDIAAFTNIGTDHISDIEHKDFEDYFSSKLKIFDCCKTAVINSDSEHFDRIINTAKGKCEILTYGSSPEDDIYCSDIEKKNDNIYFNVRTPDYEKEFYLTMPGVFNVSNALCAIAIAYILGIPESFISDGLSCARASGRMQVYKSKDEKIVVIVDYAHNKMSFEALYNTVGIEYPGRDIITIFGCPGYKAQLRRKDLGELAGKHSNYVYLVEEDSGKEPFINIAKDIESHLGDCPHTIIEDRAEAISDAILNYADKPRILLITGKGEETRLKRGTEYVDCPSDVELTLKYLDTYDNSLLAIN